jgi:2-succinyl-6-hydroxy-2,4-cyclohexadiene-1-carboxylate synthase
VHVDGGPVRWFVRDEGPRGGRVLVFLHGFAGTGSDWDATRAKMPPEWRTITPDLPGHGESPAPPNISFEKIPRMMEAMLESLGVRRAVFAGYSFGARIALSLAAYAPQLVSGLVLESAHPGLVDEAQRNERRRRDEEDARTLERDGLDAFLKVWHERPVFATRRSGPGWEEEVEKKRQTNHPRRLAAMMRGLGLSAQPDFAKLLTSYRGPMLLVAGEQDPTYVEHARRLREGHPDTRRVALAPCGHNVHVEAPFVFQQLLGDFLREAPDPGPES